MLEFIVVYVHSLSGVRLKLKFTIQRYIKMAIVIGEMTV